MNLDEIRSASKHLHETALAHPHTVPEEATLAISPQAMTQIAEQLDALIAEVERLRDEAWERQLNEG